MTKIVPGTKKAHIPRIKTAEQLLVDPLHLQPDLTAIVKPAAVGKSEVSLATMEVIGAPPADLSASDLEHLAAQPQDTADDLHRVALARAGDIQPQTAIGASQAMPPSMTPSPSPSPSPGRSAPVMGLGAPVDHFKDTERLHAEMYGAGKGTAWVNEAAQLTGTEAPTPAEASTAPLPQPLPQFASTTADAPDQPAPPPASQTPPQAS